MALVRKNTSPNKSNEPRQQIIKINPYENADNVMELMASICSAVPAADTNLYWDIINDAYNKEINGKCLREYLIDNRGNLINPDLDFDLKHFCRELSWNLSTRENTNHTQIVVAGGFSSGKSSFLNRLTNSANLLPTGVEPVSVVKTYLYCSKECRTITVKGVNQKNVLVNLDPGVLQAIQHAKSSNIYLASVLDKLFVEVPSTGLDGIVFIDTPGYNNSDRANQSNGKTDKETAEEALSEGNVLFWLIDCERGTTVTNDIEVIKKFNGKKVFIFNKADKKGEFESRRIVEEAARTLYKEFEQDEIIDILAYSTLDDKVYYSKNNYNLTTIVNKAKAAGNGQSEMNLNRETIEKLFDDEIEACRATIESINENYKENLEWKERSQKNYQDAKEFQEYLIDALNTVLIESYDEVLDAANDLQNSSSYAIDRYEEFWSAVNRWDDTDHSAVWENTLIPILNRGSEKFKTCCDKHNEAINYQYYENSYRRELVQKVKAEEDFIVEKIKTWYDDACEECKNALDRKSHEERMIKDIQTYKQAFLAALDQGIRQYKSRDHATNVNSDELITLNVFDAIKKNDYKQFLRSFESGVDISLSNAEGYNPMTLAVQMGNNMMVQFLLSQNADPAIKDRRGYNAFHTAVENQYRDICKMLLDVDPDLLDSKTDKGESVDELARKQTFNKWLETEINNAC